MIKIEHVAIWSKDIERLRIFYEKYFGAQANDMYFNPNKQLQTYFLRFREGARLEIMQRPEVQNDRKTTYPAGYTHLAFSLGSKQKVDELTRLLAEDGYPTLDGPRTTGDGYYESVVLDPDGNHLELTV
jgi:lactoylglutathione lyase